MRERAIREENQAREAAGGGGGSAKVAANDFTGMVLRPKKPQKDE